LLLCALLFRAQEVVQWKVCIKTRLIMCLNLETVEDLAMINGSGVLVMVSELVAR